MDYSKQANQKMVQVGEPHPDRNAVDTKKKENIGNFNNCGQEYHKKKEPREVLDHDFPLKELGKISPYGVYNLNHNTGFVNLGVSHDTSEFADESISRWWASVGKPTCQTARESI